MTHNQIEIKKNGNEEVKKRPLSPYSYLYECEFFMIEKNRYIIKFEKTFRGPVYKVDMYIIINIPTFKRLASNDFKDNHYFYIKRFVLMITDKRKDYEGYTYYANNKDLHSISKADLHYTDLNGTDESVYCYIYKNCVLKFQGILDLFK